MPLSPEVEIYKIRLMDIIEMQHFVKDSSHDTGRASAPNTMGRRINPSWWTIELFLVPASAP